MLTLGEFKFVVATTSEMLDAVYRLRYQVYVDEFGFEHAGDHPGGREMDEWDPFSIHMAALNTENDVIGTIRLVLNSPKGLPTLHAVEPLYQDKNPHSRHIGEVSRLAVARSFRRRVEDGFYGVNALASPKGSIAFHRAEEGEFPSQDRRRRFAVVLGLFKIMYHVSKRIDLVDWYMMCEKRLWYLLRRYHILFNPVGPEMEYHGVRIPYIGHIRDIENHMMKVSSTMAESFQEGLEPKSGPAQERTAGTLEEGLSAPSVADPGRPGENGARGDSSRLTEADAEREAQAAAKAVSEIVWPHHIRRNEP